MNKIVQFGFIVAASLAVTACASFRINMAEGYDAHNPPTPAPPAPAKEWVDVKNWQKFLVGQGLLDAGKFTVDKFDDPTQDATKKFQLKHYASVGSEDDVLPDTGCVNVATFRKAVRVGLPHYKSVRTENMCVPPTKRRTHKTGSNTIYAADNFHDNVMGTNCTGNDVRDWQYFLKMNGYLPSNFTITGTYDAATTKPATKKFQQAWSITGDTLGDVGVNTFNYSISTTTAFYNAGGMLLVSMDHTTTPTPINSGCGTP